MDSDLLRALCALAAFVLPLALAWAIVWWQGRPQKRRRQHGAGHGL
ncbi:hypothetical protein [Polaromonas sp. CF318]|nr:hypothetical protein [Polaromonas sp. CF318]